MELSFHWQRICTNLQWYLRGKICDFAKLHLVVGIGFLQQCWKKDIFIFLQKMFSYFSIRSVFFHSVEKREILCHSKISSNQLFREIVAKKVWERIFSVPLEMVQNKILVNFTISKLACTIRETQCVTVCKMKNIPWK